MIHDIIHMDWPFALVLVAAIIALVVVYCFRRAMADEASKADKPSM